MKILRIGLNQHLPIQEISFHTVPLESVHTRLWDVPRKDLRSLGPLSMRVNTSSFVLLVNFNFNFEFIIWQNVVERQ